MPPCCLLWECRAAGSAGSKGIGTLPLAQVVGDAFRKLLGKGGLGGWGHL